MNPPKTLAEAVAGGLAGAVRPQTVRCQRSTRAGRSCAGTAGAVVLAVVIVVAQLEEPHQPHDQSTDVEDAEPDHEDPPLQAHPTANLKPFGACRHAFSVSCRPERPSRG